jgi:TIGR03009 family protein
MRTHWLTSAAFLVLAVPLLAQQPAAPPVLDPARNKLDEVLLNWEKSMTGVQSLLVVINRTNIEKVYQVTEVFEGSAKFVKSNQRGQTSRASMKLIKKGRPDIYEQYICSGTFLYEFAPLDKVIRIHELPPPKDGQVADDNFLSFLFGMKAVDAKARYKLTYVPPLQNDKWYYYLKVEPIAAADMADFTEARLTLSNSTFLPRQLWFRQPNGNEVTWDFPKVVNGADIPLSEFAQPALPAADWKYVRVPRENAPRVVRPKQ